MKNKKLKPLLSNISIRYKIAILTIIYGFSASPTIAAPYNLLDSDVVAQAPSDFTERKVPNPKCVRVASDVRSSTPEANLAPSNPQLVKPGEGLKEPSQGNSSLTRPNPILENNQQPQPDVSSKEPSQNNPAPENNQPQPNQRFLVKKIRVRDYKIYNPEKINSITQPVEGKTVTLQELADVADKITALYLKDGYITSRAVLVNQVIDTGEVVIRVFEGGVDEIRVEGTQRISPEYICSRIKLAGLSPLRKQKLEDQLILLRSDPIFKNLEASLRPASEGTFGQSTIIVRVTEASPIKGAFGIDNYSPPSIGSERLGVGLSYRSLVTSGDQISASYNRSTTGGLNLYDFNYRVPLNAMDGTLQVRAVINDTKITDPQYKNLNIRGDFQQYEVNYRQPLIRTPRQEFALSLGFTYQDGQTFLFDSLPFPFGIGPDKNGVSRTSVFRFGQDYVSREKNGAWSARSLFNFGTGLFDATTNNGAIPDGQFFSWYGQLQRTQKLSEDQLLIVGLDLQLTPDSLLPSQQFVIGGAQTVRGYRQNARSGDNGVRFSIEDQITVLRNEAGLATLQLSPFIDLGTVWNNPDNPNNVFLLRQRFLASAGLGLLWQPIPNLNVRLDYGIPFVNLRDRGDNAQDSGFYFSVYYQP